ncbi:peptidoglycan-binding domain-containing protein [Nocardiopsis ganjiahuensis]|uniref:peptidoglycan-binding domain-containing protein n=1 Tax=Nocardiopsis ganjiahuensis TaxID=239984 RepID=UPI0019552D90
MAAFQDAHGLDPVDGVPGPETRAAVDLALSNKYPPLWWSHLAVSDGDWLGPASAPEVRRAPLVPGLPL